MKLFYALFLSFLLSMSIKSQQFLWADSYEIPDCNEVAALSIDTNGYIFITGVHNASASLPYTGNCYLQKTDQEGEVIWTKYISGSVQIGDMAAVDASVVIIGQSNGPFTYQDEQYGTSEMFMFVMKLDAGGNHEWHYIDETKYGANTNISIGKLGNFALHIRGQYNLGDWVMIMDADGNILNTKEIYAAASTVVDIAYYNGWVFLNGGFNGPGSIIIDTIVINVPPVESAAFVLALNEDLVAKWVSVDTTFNNLDGRIVASDAGVFVYESVLTPPFNLVSVMKKFSLSGQFLIETEAPVFSNAIALYPDMTITPTKVGLFVENDFSFNSHKVILFDHNLNIITEKFIDGSSDLYSGQIADFGDDIFVAHVFSGDLEFSDELILPYSGSGKLPYIAKIGTLSYTGLNEKINSKGELLVYPNPADKKITVNTAVAESGLIHIRINDMDGNAVLEEFNHETNTLIDISYLPANVYIVQVMLPGGRTLREKILIR